MRVTPVALVLAAVATFSAGSVAGEPVEKQAGGVTQPAVQNTAAPGEQAIRITANDVERFRARVSRCWKPAKIRGAEEFVVKVRIELNPDGTLMRPPRLVNAGSSRAFKAAAASAMRAVRRCQPYRLPREKYDQWRDLLLNFDPRRMYGG